MLRRAIAIFSAPVLAVAKALRSERVDTTPEVLAVEAEIDELPESVRWARQFVGQGEYCLGAGGKYPTALKPWTRCAKPAQHRHRNDKDTLIFADCSGFLCRAWGIPRQNADGTWNNTDHLEAVAREQGLTWADARPGDGIVYGAGRQIGHCGLIDTIDEHGPTIVIHCSASGRHAVKREGMDLWRRKGALIVRRPALPET